MGGPEGLEPSDSSNDLELCQECKKLSYSLYGGFCQDCYEMFEAEEMADRASDLKAEEGHG